MPRFSVAVAILLCIAVQSYAQVRTVHGVVSDNVGPLAGASVMLKGSGTAAGTVTDLDGNYSIQVSSDNAVLVFSSIGYKTQEVTPGKSLTLNVILEEDITALDEVVVIGYGTQAKSHLTGSISKLDGAGLIDIPVSDVATALQGQVAGLTISNTTSEVGVTPTIRVRGTGSISADSGPLVIVDGYPVADGLNSVNASDIKSIEVLKDASSAAIYGSRAANGVIMITTKSGDIDKPSYSVKVYEGVKYAYKLHDIMTQTEYRDLQILEESWGGPAVKTQDKIGAWLEENMGSVDWQREGLRNFADIKNIQFSVSGGKPGSRYYISASATDDKGLMWQNENKKINFRTKLDLDLSKIVKFGVNVSFAYQNTSRPVNNFIDFYRTPSFLPVRHNDWSTALTGYSGYARGSHFNSLSAPVGDPDEYGNPTWSSKASPFSSSNNNPKHIMETTERSNEAFNALANAYLEINICKGLKFRTSDGANVRFAPGYTYSMYGAKKDGDPSAATYSSVLRMNLLSENTLNYDLKAGKHAFNALLGYTVEFTRLQKVHMSATGFPTDDIHTLNAATVFEIAAANNGNGAGTGTFRYPNEILESGLGRVTYSYDDRYLLSASIRLDRSSLFSKDKRNAWFPSVSAGWRISQEPWMKDVNWLNQLKLRASYGVTGNNNVAYTSSMELFSGANYTTGSGNGSLIPGAANISESLSNPNLTWEQTDEFNVGLDFGALNSRINLSVDAYYSITRSLLFAQPTQSFTGFTKYWNNIGRVRNAGMEFQLDTYNIQKKDFTWSTSINLSFNRNRLLEIGGEAQMITLGERDENYIARVGDPLIQFFGYKTNGVWNSLDEIEANPHMSNDVPGGLRIVDTNGDGVLNTDDRVPLGSPYPAFNYGMTNTFKIKRFDVSFLIQGVQGGMVYNGDVYYNETHKYNRAYINNRWVSESHPGDGKTTYGKAGYNICLTDYPLQDASYVCLRNATIGFTLTKKDLKNALSGLRFYVTGNNLAYLWGKSYKGINPESRTTTGSNYDSPLVSGYQKGGFPVTSTVTFGIDVKF